MKRQLLRLAFVLMGILAAQAQELTVCTYNVRYKNSGDTDAGNGWNTRRTYLINFVNFQMPDLLGVQEAVKAQMDDMANGLKGYAYIGVGRTDGGTSGEYSAIFYRKDRMVVLDHGDFWLSDTPWKPSKGFPSQGGSEQYYRICTWGKFFDKATGTVIYHFNTHLDLDETNRQQSYYLIKQKIMEVASTSAPVIISGDYNAVQTGEAYKLFYESGFLYDCFLKAKQKFITNGTCAGFNACNYNTVNGEFRRIDHIFVTKAFTIDRYAALNPCYYSTDGTADYPLKAYSDHSPVIVKLTIKNPEMSELNTTPPPAVDGVYQISNLEELKAFSYIVNGIEGYTKNAKAKAVLLNDIDMTGVSFWRPIGMGGTQFQGTFDGQGHHISNFSMTKISGDKNGLFGNVKNATIQNFSISGKLSFLYGGSGAGVIGWAEGSTIRNVHSMLNITTTKSDIHHVGGVCGSLRVGSTASGCSFSGTLKDTGNNDDCFGGIGGYSNEKCLYENCANYGTILFSSPTCYAGGILGYINNTAFYGVKNCLNVGTVKMTTDSQPTYGGALIGRARGLTVSNNQNNYWLEGSGNGACAGENPSSTGAVTAEQLKSGSICYALNGNQAVINWFQTLATDDYPVLDPTHLQVFLSEEGAYFNDDPNGITDLKEADDLRNSVIYNIAGQRLAKPMEGINIINGKKYIRK